MKDKLIEAAEDALQVARCDHELRLVSPDVKDPKKFDRYVCRKCQAIFYEKASQDFVIP